MNPYFTTRFAGMNREQSRPLIDDLAARATVAANVYRHRWRAGDVVMWDNRCVMHYAEYGLRRQPAAPDEPHDRGLKSCRRSGSLLT